MGIYAVTGGTKGIGEKTVEILKECGHEVVNIDIDGGDICANLGTDAGRQYVIDTLHEIYPGGLDGFVSNAGIASSKKLSPVLSVNYFGAVKVVEGVYDLLQMKKGRCVVTVSGSIAYLERGIFSVDKLLTDCGDEERIGRLVDSFDPALVDNAIYGSTKIALVRWIRRLAPSWMLHGVNLNAVAPGGVATTIMNSVETMGLDTDIMLGLPMPQVYRERKMMDPADIAQAIAFLVQPGAKGISGEILYCDGGTSSLLHPEKTY
jgi:NAD(P)-dependent dehydrogenase (short-subunit alcohol dehydrogenase family)